MTTLVTHVHIGQKKFDINKGLVQGHQLMQLGGLSSDDRLVLDIQDEIDIPVDATDWIIIRGGERFAITDCAHTVDDNPCLRVPIRFHLNGELIPKEQALKHAKVKVIDLKQLDPHLKSGFALVADLDGLADEHLQDDQRMLVQPHDRYITVPCGNVGDSDVISKHLSNVHLAWPTAQVRQEGQVKGMVIPEYQLPHGWSVTHADILVIIPNGYPVTALDMFYVSPSITLSDGRVPQGASGPVQILGRSWQQFSWHYRTPSSDWIPARSSLSTHLAFVHSRLKQLN